MHRIYPRPLKLSHRYATEVDFQISEMGPLAYYMADDFFIPNPPLSMGTKQVYGIYDTPEHKYQLTPPPPQWRSKGN